MFGTVIIQLLLDPAPTTPTHVANIALPYVQIDKVVPEDTQGTVDKGLGSYAYHYQYRNC